MTAHARRGTAAGPALLLRVSVFIWVCLERRPEGSGADGHRARTGHVKGVVFGARSVAEAAALFGLETSSPGGGAEGACRPLVRASVFLIMPRRVVRSGNDFDPLLPSFGNEAPPFPWDPRLAHCQWLFSCSFIECAYHTKKFTTAGGQLGMFSGTWRVG